MEWPPKGYKEIPGLERVELTDPDEWYLMVSLSEDSERPD